MRIIEQLRRGGYKVRIIHRRTYISDEFFYKVMVLSTWERDNQISVESVRLIGPLEKGGECEVSITTPMGKTFNALSECSVKDNYSRSEGLKKALNRALHEMKTLKGDANVKN